jgi:hypothetical protein
MNQPIIKIYVVSLMACQKSTDLLNESKGMMYWEHAPLLLTSDSIESAAIQSRIIALDSWKPTDGWSMHSASITPMTSVFINELFGLIQQGIISVQDDPTEQQQFFRFDDSLAVTDFENPISTDEH